MSSAKKDDRSYTGEHTHTSEPDFGTVEAYSHGDEMDRQNKRPMDYDEGEGGDGYSPAAAYGVENVMPRTKSTLNLLLISIIIMSVPYGVGTTFFYSLIQGGPLTVIWCWFIMSFISLCIAASLGEIASRYPTSGGVYYWSYMMSTPKYRALTSYVVGWLSLCGNIIVTLTANFGTTQLILASVNLYYPDYLPKPWHTVLTSWGLIIVVGTIAILGQKALPKVDGFMIVWITAGVLATAITLPVKAASGTRSAAEVFTIWQDQGAGWPRGWSFVMALIQGAYCFSPIGMLASMADEMKTPETSVPIAMVGGVAVNSIFGIVFLLPILFTAGDIGAALLSPTGQPLPALYLQATGGNAAAFGLFFIVLLNGVACGLACSQVSSRCTWAFARDGAIPGSKYLARVSQRHQMPVNAFLLCVVVQVLLSCLYFGSSAAFNAFISVAVICLGTSYVIPVIISVARGRDRLVGAKFYLGRRFGMFCNVITIAWYVFAIPLLSFPTTIPVLANTMNYAAAVYIGFAVLAIVWYLTWGKSHFRGPPELAQIM